MLKLVVMQGKLVIFGLEHPTIVTPLDIAELLSRAADEGMCPAEPAPLPKRIEA